MDPLAKHSQATLREGSHLDTVFAAWMDAGAALAERIAAR